MSGGAERKIPKYYDDNAPGIPNIEKEIMRDSRKKNTDNSGETAPYVPKGRDGKPLNQLVNLQVYSPEPPKEQTVTAGKVKIPFNEFMAQPMPGQYTIPAGEMPLGSAFLPRMGPPSLYVSKNYNINVGGPTADHQKVLFVYEDILPSKQFKTSYNTLDERLTFFNFLRSTMFCNGDGDRVSLDGYGERSLLNSLKFLDLNPYNTNKFSNNPYKGLPDNMLIYRSCYPIKHNPNIGGVSCAINSVGLNVRIYSVSEGSYNINVTNTGLYKDFEEWREIGFYEFVREKIMKRHISPNFVNFFGYYMSTDSKIDFAKINELKSNPTSGLADDLPFLNTKKISPTAARYVDVTPPPISIIDPLSGKAFSDVDEITGKIRTYIPNMAAKLGKALIAVTESPTYTFLKWTSREYVHDGNVRKMVNTGYHTEIVWYSILFQIMSALYCLQINKIAINNFNPEQHIYIRDLDKTPDGDSGAGPATKYWKYKIDGIEYYIPNYGYLALIDSNFKDLDKASGRIVSSSLYNHKILSNEMYGDPIDTIQKINEEAFKSTFNDNIFNSPIFKDNQGCMPPGEILAFLNKIYSSVAGKSGINIGDCIFKYMRKFINNRVGTYLKENELQNIRRDNLINLEKGQIVVLEDAQTGANKFVMFVSRNSDGRCLVLNKNKNSTEIVESEVHISSLFGYSEVEPIQQNYKPNESLLNEDELLETYVMYGST
jgi:hypothetical protein